MSRSSVATAAQRDPLETPYYFGKVGEVASSRSHGTRSATFPCAPRSDGRHVRAPLSSSDLSDISVPTTQSAERRQGLSAHITYTRAHTLVFPDHLPVGTTCAVNHQTPN